MPSRKALPAGSNRVARRLHNSQKRLVAEAVSALLLGVALWQTAGCVVPPPEVEDVENFPPVIDWALTTPPEYHTSVIDLALVGEQIDFSIEGAVYDPDGEDLYFQWYWETLQQGVLRSLGALDHAVLRRDIVCLESGVADSAVDVLMMVHVVVSDHPLDWTGALDEPVVVDVDDNGNPFPLIERVWLVGTKGDCGLAPK